MTHLVNLWYIFCINFLINLKLGCSQPNNIYYNTYGDDYGTKWIYFPGEDGTSHYVNLEISEDEYLLKPRGLMNDEIEYRLYTRNNTESYLLLDDLAKPVDETEQKIMKQLLSDKPLKVVTHGWLSSANSSGVLSLKRAYLDTHDVNVIAVDWSAISGSIFYHWVANDTMTVGTRLASFLDGLHQYYNISGGQIHLLGHSLGAHVVGIAASKTKFRVDRVTGLDPARPLFEYPLQENSAKLDSTDADFVDIIHTCSGVLGYVASIGTVDFYPNSGMAPQPGCDSFQRIFEACSHSRAYYYFEESIKNPTAFLSYQCHSWEEFLKNQCDHYIYMGDNVSRNVSGKYYLKTNAFRPFGVGIK